MIDLVDATWLVMGLEAHENMLCSDSQLETGLGEFMIENGDLVNCGQRGNLLILNGLSI